MSRPELDNRFEHFGGLAWIGFLICAALCLGRFLSRFIHGMPPGILLRFGFSFEGFVLLMLAWKYRTSVAACAMGVVLFIFNPISLVPLAHSWLGWQVVNAVGLISFIPVGMIVMTRGADKSRTFHNDREAWDMLRYYDDESYLIDDVGRWFRTSGEIDPADFWMILLWKANRAKGYHRDRLKRLSRGSFADAVRQISSQLREASTDKDRLRVLMMNWEFPVPTATAILTILYPDRFTVYDYRVREVLDLDYDLSQRTYSDQLWVDYKRFLETVKASAPAHLSLRDKDRWLTGKSYREQIESECAE
jgi:hypothetical protein